MHSLHVDVIGVNRLDAGKSRALAQEMNARQFEQGVLAAQMGLSPEPTWSKAHMAGFQAFMSGQPLRFILGGTPAMLREVA